MIIEYFELDEKVSPIVFSVIVAEFNGKFVIVKHKNSEYIEFPECQVKSGETPEEAAIQKLFQETGAKNFTLTPVSNFRILNSQTNETYNKDVYSALFYAKVKNFSNVPIITDMVEILFFRVIPNNLKFNDIFASHAEKVKTFLNTHRDL